MREALQGPQDAVTTMLDEYRTRRDNIHAWLTANPGIKCVKPKGAFYLFPDISALLTPDGIRTSAEFADRLLHEAHVALTPGEAFEAGDGAGGASYPEMTATHRWVLGTVGLFLLVLIYGLSRWHWYLVEMGALFVAMTVVLAALIGVALGFESVTV